MHSHQVSTVLLFPIPIAASIPNPPCCSLPQALSLSLSPGLSPNCQEFMEQIRRGSEQGSPGQIQGFLPPRIRTQPCHDPTVILQRESDDVPIKGEVLFGSRTPAEGEALIPAQRNHTGPGGGKANTPVHAARCLRLPFPPPLAGAVRMGKGRSAEQRARRGWSSGAGSPWCSLQQPPPSAAASRLCLFASRRLGDVIAPGSTKIPGQ